MNHFWKGVPGDVRRDLVVCCFLDWWTDHIPDESDSIGNWISGSSDHDKDTVHRLKIAGFRINHHAMVW